MDCGPGRGPLPEATMPWPRPLDRNVKPDWSTMFGALVSIPEMDPSIGAPPPRHRPNLLKIQFLIGIASGRNGTLEPVGCSGRRRSTGAPGTQVD